MLRHDHVSPPVTRSAKAGKPRGGVTAVLHLRWILAAIGKEALRHLRGLGHMVS